VKGYNFDHNWNIYPVVGECDFLRDNNSIHDQLTYSILTGKRFISDELDDNLPDFSAEMRDILLMKYGWYFDSKIYSRNTTTPYKLKELGALNLDGPYNQTDGYGTMTEQLTLAFRGLGYMVGGSRAWSEQNNLTNVSPDVLLTLGGHIRTPCGIRLGQPDSYQACPGDYKVIYTMWEFPLLPDRWYNGIKNVGLTIVPCGWNKLLWNQVQPNNTVVIPLGVNPKIYYPVERNGRSSLTFLTDGSLLGENNITEVFSDLFSSYPDVRLVVKMKGERRVETEGNVVKLYGRFTAKEMREWYQSGDVFLYPTHAEGFGLFPLEAMATGLPVIATDNPAMKSFMWEEHSYPVEVKNVDWYHYCDMDNMAEKMMCVYNNFEGAKNKGRRAAKFIADHFTWKHTAERIIEVLS
jgi:glycosyltransferase involved in cell wall biosynthesis